MDPDGGNKRDLDGFFGGQGTINVNSWSPDGKCLAYVTYPVLG
jgi:Tol biopolymer transport system component